MSEQNKSLVITVNYDKSKLLKECQSLIVKISKRPYSISLLTKIKSYLEMYLTYKSKL